MADSLIRTDNISSVNGGGVGFPDGSASNPSIRFTNDPDTGFYRIGQNRIGISSNGNKVGEIGSDYGAFRGNVVQCQIIRYDVRTTLTTGTTVLGTEIIPLRVAITPKFSNSMILCMFQIHCEISNNSLMNVYRNGVVPEGVYAGFNREIGNVVWSGLATNFYDVDNNSTPFQTLFYYQDFPGTTNRLTYAPGVKTSDGTNYTLALNRTIGSLGQSGYENGTSFSIVWEIVQ